MGRMFHYFFVVARHLFAHESIRKARFSYEILHLVALPDSGCGCPKLPANRPCCRNGEASCRRGATSTYNSATGRWDYGTDYRDTIHETDLQIGDRIYSIERDDVSSASARLIRPASTRSVFTFNCLMERNVMLASLACARSSLPSPPRN